MGNIKHLNKACADAIECNDSELMLTNHKMINPPNMPKAILNLVWSLLKKGEPICTIAKNNEGNYYLITTEFETLKNANKKYFVSRKIISYKIVEKHIEPLYAKLVELESFKGIRDSENYLYNFLKKQNKTYIDYISGLANAN